MLSNSKDLLNKMSKNSNQLSRSQIDQQQFVTNQNIKRKAQRNFDGLNFIEHREQIVKVPTKRLSNSNIQYGNSSVPWFSGDIVNINYIGNCLQESALENKILNKIDVGLVKIESFIPQEKKIRKLAQKDQTRMYFSPQQTSKYSPDQLKTSIEFSKFNSTSQNQQQTKLLQRLEAKQKLKKLNSQEQSCSNLQIPIQLIKEQKQQISNRFKNTDLAHIDSKKLLKSSANIYNDPNDNHKSLTTRKLPQVQTDFDNRMANIISIYVNANKSATRQLIQNTNLQEFSTSSQADIKLIKKSQSKGIQYYNDRIVSRCNKDVQEFLDQQKQSLNNKGEQIVAYQDEVVMKQKQTYNSKQAKTNQAPMIELEKLTVIDQEMRNSISRLPISSMKVCNNLQLTNPSISLYNQDKKWHQNRKKSVPEIQDLTKIEQKSQLLSNEKSEISNADQQFKIFKQNQKIMQENKHSVRNIDSQNIKIEASLPLNLKNNQDKLILDFNQTLEYFKKTRHQKIYQPSQSNQLTPKNKPLENTRYRHIKSSQKLLLSNTESRQQSPRKSKTNKDLFNETSVEHTILPRISYDQKNNSGKQNWSRQSENLSKIMSFGQSMENQIQIMNQKIDHIKNKMVPQIRRSSEMSSSRVKSVQFSLPSSK
eukprot:403349098